MHHYRAFPVIRLFDRIAMKRIGAVLLIGFVLGLAMTGPVTAQGKPKEGKINLKILPPAVRKAFRSAYPHAVLKGVSKETENGVTLYKIKIVDGKTKRDLLYFVDGKIEKIEESVAPENLPLPVKQTLDKEYPGAEILKAEILTKAGAKMFELFVKVKGETLSVTIDF